MTAPAPIPALPSGCLVCDPDAPADGLRVFVAEPFRFFFSLDESPAAPAERADSDGDGVPDFVACQLGNLMHAFDVFRDGMGLPDIRTHGRMAGEGLRFVDVLLDALPVQRGLAAAGVESRTPGFLAGGPWEGPSVVLRLHRALPAESLTPAHELFHIFQYAALPFRNMWFMEGLARHGQRWADHRPVKSVPLPCDRAALEALLRQWHDAEVFWNRLAALCAPAQAAGSAAAEVTPAAGGIGANPHLRGQALLPRFFAEARAVLAELRAEMPGRALAGEAWSAAEARSASNNRYLLRALVRAIAALDLPPQPERDAFVALVETLDREAEARCAQAEVQRLFALLRDHALAPVSVTAAGRLVCEAFDPVTASLSLPELRIGAQIPPVALEAFRALRGLVGKLVIADCPALQRLPGFASLVAIEGSLAIERTGLVALEGAFTALERIKGSLRIADHPALVAVADFPRLVSVDASLELVDLPALQRVAAFPQLREIKKGRLCIANAPALAALRGFGALAQVRDILFDRLGLREVDCLQPLFARQPDHPGFIKITACRLEDAGGLAPLRSVASSLYLHGNALPNVDALASLERVGGSLSLSNNRLTDLRGLARLRRVNGMLGLARNRLASLSGLEGLERLATTRWGTQARTLVIHTNPALVDIEALAGVGTADDYLVLHCDDLRQYVRRPRLDTPFHRNILQIHQAPDQRVVPTYLWTGKRSHDYGRFRAATHNPKLVYLHDFETEADTLVLSFSGLNGTLGGVFHNRFPLIVEGIATHKVFVNDTRNQWYQGGIPGVTADLAGTLALLRQLARHRDYRKIVCVGVSMGGYMALLAGREIGASDVLAFAPQTFLDPANRARYGDTRWAKLLKGLPAGAPSRHLDLAELYRAGGAPPNIRLYYGRGTALDVCHVEHLAAVATVTRCGFDVDDHYISIHMDRRLGVLNDEIRRVVMA